MELPIEGAIGRALNWPKLQRDVVLSTKVTSNFAHFAPILDLCRKSFIDYTAWFHVYSVVVLLAVTNESLIERCLSQSILGNVSD